MVTVSVKLADRETEPAVAVIVTVDEPAGVVDEVVSVSVVEQVGTQDVAENDEVTPEGRPAIEKATICAVPDVKVSVTAGVTD